MITLNCYKQFYFLNPTFTYMCNLSELQTCGKK